jgi:hypothetical protein
VKKLRSLILLLSFMLNQAIGQGLEVNPSNILFKTGTTTNGYLAQISGNILFGALSTSSLNFFTNGQSRLHIGSNGNIGLGAGFTNPQSLFHISHNTASNDLLPHIRLTQTSDPNSGRIRMENSTGAKYFMNKFFHDPVGNSILSWDYNGTELFRAESNKNFRINGFTKLGDDAATPGIKTKKLTGTTAPTENADVNIPHGLNLAKILSVRILVDTGTELIESGYTVGSNSRFNFKVNASNIVVTNVNISSSAILSKPMRIYVTYEE